MVFVDKFQYSYRGMLMSHMLADTTKELLEMADAIEVKRKYIQDAGTPKEHFDVCDKMRKRAIRLGAKEVTTRELVNLIQKKRLASNRKIS